MLKGCVRVSLLDCQRHRSVMRSWSWSCRRPEVVSDHVQMRKLGREYARLSSLVKLGEQWSTVHSEIEDARQIIAEESDPETLEWATSVLEEQLDALPDLESQVNLALMPPDETADADAVLEVRAGTGGEEAALFAAELYRMFLRYAERNGWKTSIVNVNETGIGGVKEVVFEVAGESAYSRLKHESGVHRVQRVPATESQGRIHTSAATVAVLPKAEGHRCRDQRQRPEGRHLPCWRSRRAERE